MKNRVSPEGYIYVRLNLIYSIFMLITRVGSGIWDLSYSKEEFTKYSEPEG